ncbi:coat protein [Bacillaceae bacterium SIJ1]|uniref:major capsid protein n=1 Tax=Litoribacterium kuwaitense TaxID=1398745 RepID=UPI0013EC4AF9|nr:major capsid protein [Litoribacterium kuwaitense]NGP45976.1 coat protein [Litoribacterium kuwaitense]
MPSTKIADVIVPDVFNPYVVERTAELSAFYQSGIISNNEELNRLATSGGRILNMPFWEDLNGDDEVLSDQTPLKPNRIESSKDAAVLHLRGKAWGVNDLAKALSGDDPMAAIADLVADYWARQWQKLTLATLEGVFAAPSMSDNVLDVSGETDGVFDGDSFIDALHRMGDAESRLTALGVHSATYASMRKQGLIEFIRDQDNNIDFPSYMGKRLIIDDSMTVEEVTPAEGDPYKAYTTYLFGQGAIGYGEGGAPVPTETDRDSLQGEDILINRRHFIMHPRGVRFMDKSVAGEAPTNAELTDQTNWQAVYEPKNIRMVAFKHKLL